MKITLRFLQACLLLLLASACANNEETPEPEPEPQVEENCLVTATRVDGWKGRNTRYTYDEQERLIAITNDLDEGSSEYFTYTYDSDGRIIRQEKTFKKGGAPEYIGLYYYDSEGNVIRYENFHRSTEPEYLLELAVFTYNSENVLVKDRRDYYYSAYPVRTRRNLYYANGQVVRVERRDDLDVVTLEEVLTYTQDLIPLRGGTAYEKITNAIGYPSKHLIASYTVKDRTGIMENVSFNGHTTLMAGGKVSTYVIKFKEGTTSTETYAYTCK